MKIKLINIKNSNNYQKIQISNITKSLNFKKINNSIKLIQSFKIIQIQYVKIAT